MAFTLKAEWTEVLDGLDALIENPDANLEQLCA